MRMPAKPLMSAWNLFTFGHGWGLELTRGGEDATVAECGVDASIMNGFSKNAIQNGVTNWQKAEEYS